MNLPCLKKIANWSKLLDFKSLKARAMTSSNKSSTIRVLKKIQDDITCAVCLDRFKDPKVLHCHHEFCKDCLVAMTAKNKDTSSITCPKCRHQTTLPDGKGVEGLQSALSAQKFLDLEITLQRSAEKTLICERHENEKINMFCEPCKTLICAQCIIHDHNGHQYKDVSEVTRKCKQELHTGLDAAAKVPGKIETLTTKFEGREEEVLTQQSKLESQVNEMVAELQQALESKRSSLLSELQNLSSAKLQSLSRRKRDVKKWQIKVESCVRDGQTLLGGSREDAVITGTEGALNSINRTCSEFRQANTDVNEEANIGIASNLDATLQSLDIFAAITTCKSCPQKCYARGTGLSSACVGEAETVTVYVMNSKTQPCMQGSMNDIEFDMVSDVDGKIASGAAKRTKENQYELSYVPKFKGFHDLGITIRDQHIYGSPFRVAAKSPISSLGILIKTITTVPNPSALTITPSGNMLVLSETDQCIFVVKQSGELVREIEVPAIFSDITVGNDNSIYAVNAVENQVVKFSAEGTPINASIKAIGNPTRGVPTLSGPKGLAYNPKNRKIYVSNTNSHDIHVLNEDLTHHKTIGREGTGKLQFKSPRGICCDHTGRVFVTDSNNDRIQVLGPDGKFVRMFGETGDQQGRLKRPLGVAIDTDRQIYISEGTNDRVSIFAPNGNFLKCFGGDGVMKKPCGIAVDSNCGTVLVCNYGLNSIQIF